MTTAVDGRRVRLERTTRETSFALTLDLDGAGEARVATGIGFLDHLLSTLARYAEFDLTLEGTGDLGVDDHHTAEDAALLLGRALDRVLGAREGLQRFGSAYAPLDEALARAVVDLSGRPWPAIRLDLTRERIGGLATENVTHVLNTLAIEMRAAVHVRVLEGANDHHKAEAACKALGLALAQALSARAGGVRSTKGVLG